MGFLLSTYFFKLESLFCDDLLELINLEESKSGKNGEDHQKKDSGMDIESPVLLTIQQELL